MISFLLGKWANSATSRRVRRDEREKREKREKSMLFVRIGVLPCARRTVSKY